MIPVLFRAAFAGERKYDRRRNMVSLKHSRL